MLAVKGVLVGLLVAGAYLHDYVLGPGLARQIKDGRRSRSGAPDRDRPRQPPAHGRDPRTRRAAQRVSPEVMAKATLLNRLDAAIGSGLERSTRAHHRRRLAGAASCARSLRRPAAGPRPAPFAPRPGSAVELLVDGAEALPRIVGRRRRGASRTSTSPAGSSRPTFRLARDGPTLRELLAERGRARRRARARVGRGAAAALPPRPAPRCARCATSSSRGHADRDASSTRTSGRCTATTRSSCSSTTASRTSAGSTSRRSAATGSTRALIRPRAASAGTTRACASRDRSSPTSPSTSGCAGTGRCRALASSRRRRRAAIEAAARAHRPRARLRRRCRAASSRSSRATFARSARPSGSSISRASSSGRPRSSTILADKLRNPPRDDFRARRAPAGEAEQRPGRHARPARRARRRRRTAARRALPRVHALPARAGTHPVYVHAKIGIVDDRWLTVGSANLNEHSLFNDTEVNVVVRDPALVRAARLRLWAEHLEQAADGDPCRVDRRAVAPSRP